jgi:hypothetical protein
MATCDWARPHLKKVVSSGAAALEAIDVGAVQSCPFRDSSRDAFLLAGVAVYLQLSPTYHLFKFPLSSNSGSRHSNSSVGGLT